MEQETLFTASKWDILKMLANGAKSPLQLAKLSKTSVANISQQLRLLEMAGLVQSKRISNRDRGQPRLLYSIVGNHSFLIASANDFVDKKLLKLSDYNKIILKIWFIDDASVHYFLEKAFWQIEPHLNDIKGILFDLSTIRSPCLNLVILTDEPPKKNEFPRLQIRQGAQAREVAFVCESVSKLSNKHNENFYVLYDPSNLYSGSRDQEETSRSNLSGGGGTFEKK